MGISYHHHGRYNLNGSVMHAHGASEVEVKKGPGEPTTLSRADTVV